jgi:hypothetical protein
MLFYIYGVCTYVLAWLMAADIDGYGFIIIIIHHCTVSSRQTDVVSGIQG